jgi:hypothetical protein
MGTRWCVRSKHVSGLGYDSRNYNGVYGAYGWLSGTFANLLIPLQIGARDMASGFLNMLSFWFFAGSSAVMLASLFIETGPASAGWTIYPPLSALPQAIPGSGLGMTLWLVSMTLFIVSSLLGGINYIVTIINLRTKGMSMDRLCHLPSGRCYHSNSWSAFVPSIVVSRIVVGVRPQFRH